MSECHHCGGVRLCSCFPVEPLSFRDQCAIAALTSIAGACMQASGMVSDAVRQKTIAWTAFDLADAMDAERQKRGAR